MLREGLELMIAGMSVVFCFLALLVAAMHGSALLFKPSDAAPTEENDYAEVALAIAAVMKHRETEKG